MRPARALADIPTQSFPEHLKGKPRCCQHESGCLHETEASPSPADPDTFMSVPYTMGQYHPQRLQKFPADLGWTRLGQEKCLGETQQLNPNRALLSTCEPGFPRSS